MSGAALITYPDRDALTRALSAEIADALRAQIAKAGHATLCLPGGSTPMPVMAALSAEALDWARVTVLLNDERWVPGDHPRSNAALIRQHLLKDRAEGAQFFDLFTGAATPEEAAPALSEALAQHLPLTVLLLGMGEDMHTASLFPNAPGLAARLAPDAPPVMAAAGGAEPRITLTLPALAGAGHRHLMLTGADKRAALDRAQGADPLSAPIAAFLDDLTVHWAA